jgi:hypothetical protein
MSKRLRIPQEIIDVLEEVGDYSFEEGTKHTKILLCGRQVGILPNGKGRDGQNRGRQHKNTVAGIKRKIREIKEAAMQTGAAMISQY